MLQSFLPIVRPCWKDCKNNANKFALIHNTINQEILVLEKVGSWGTKWGIFLLWQKSWFMHVRLGQLLCICARMPCKFGHFAHVEPRLMDSLEVESCVRGHHVYQNVWIPEMGQLLECMHEQGNSKDPYAIAVLHGWCKKTVGHLPRKILAACSIFLRKGGWITCVITAPRRFSANLPQGGLEVPCSLKFKGKQEELRKLKKLQKQKLEVSELPVKSSEDGGFNWGRAFGKLNMDTLRHHQIRRRRQEQNQHRWLADR